MRCVALGAVVVAGCGTPQPFVCDPSRPDSCGAGLSCGPFGSCLVEDATCACGQRYDVSAGEAAGTCIGNELAGADQTVGDTADRPIQLAFDDEGLLAVYPIDTSRLRDDGQSAGCGPNGRDVYIELLLGSAQPRRDLYIDVLGFGRDVWFVFTAGSCVANADSRCVSSQCSLDGIDDFEPVWIEGVAVGQYCIRIELPDPVARECAVVRVLSAEPTEAIPFDAAPHASQQCDDSMWFGRTCADLMPAAQGKTWRLISCRPDVPVHVTSTGTAHLEIRGLETVTPCTTATTELDAVIARGVNLIAALPAAQPCDVSVQITPR